MDLENACRIAREARKPEQKSTLTLLDLLCINEAHCVIASEYLKVFDDVIIAPNMELTMTKLDWKSATTAVRGIEYLVFGEGWAYPTAGMLDDTDQWYDWSTGDTFDPQPTMIASVEVPLAAVAIPEDAPVLGAPTDLRINGYKPLSEDQVAAMNTIKRFGRDLDILITTLMESDLITVDPRWVSIARTNLQQGVMALTRSVAKPEFF